MPRYLEPSHPEPIEVRERHGRLPKIMPRILPSILLGLGLGFVVLSGLAMWTLRGEAVFTDLVASAIAWCF